MDILYLVGTIIVATVVIILLSSDVLIAALELSLIIFLIVVFTYFHFRFRRICPESVGISKNGIHLKYKKDRSKFIRWLDIGEIRILGPGWPSMFGIIQAVIFYRGGKPERNAEIFGIVAQKLKDYFEEYKKQLQKLVIK